jgi:serine protease
VTAADFHDRRAGTGRGSQISLAAYGFYDESEGPPGLISTYPGAMTLRDVPDCSPLVLPTCARRNFGGDDSYAYLQGTSMATPQVTALAALVGALNPQLGMSEKLRLIKETARRSGGWSPELGWGILDAGAAVDVARRIDRLAPASRVRVKKRRGRRLRLVVHAGDRGAATGLVPSGVKRIRLYARHGHGRDRRLRRVRRGRTTVVLPRAGRWRLYTRAVDAAGNVEPPPARPDSRLRIRG